MKHDLKLRDLRSLQELLDDLEWETELIGEETDYPSLAAVLPVEEDCDERAVFTYMLCSIFSGNLYFFVSNFDLPDEDSEFTKYLQIYLQIPLKIDRIPAGELIVFVNQLNMLTLIGSFSYVPGAGGHEARVDYRYVMAMEKEALPDEGVVGEILLNLVKYAQMAEGLLASRIEGTPTEVIMAAVGHELEAGWR